MLESACRTASGARTLNRRWAHRMSATPGAAPSDSGRYRATGGTAPAPFNGPDFRPVADRRQEQEFRQRRMKSSARRRAAFNNPLTPRARCRAPSRPRRGIAARERAGDCTDRGPAAPAMRRDDCRYVALVTISRCSCFRLQPLSMNSTASQSSNSGCDGGSLCVPRSSGVLTKPGAEIRLPDAVDHRSGRGRRMAIDQPAGAASGGWRCAGRQRIQERRHARHRRARPA